MKASKQEVFDITQISKADFLFLLEVIEKLSLDEKSSALAQQSLKNWKIFREEVINFSDNTSQVSPLSSESKSSKEESTSCDGCEVNKETDGTLIQNRLCPVINKNIPLCLECYENRKLLVTK